MNEKFQNACHRKPQATPPIWMMRQAGRYHRHYQALRAQHSFMDLCKIPELAAQVALGPVADFDFDVSILFSDLLFPLEALGMGLEYTDQGPRLGFSLSEANLAKLSPLSEALPQLQFQHQAMKLTRELLPKDKSLIGFVGGPWTLYVYAVEGSHAGQLLVAKNSPLLWQGFLKHLEPLLIQNIELQFAGGAEVVMIFDTAAGELSPQQWQTWVVPSLRRLAERFPNRLGYYSKGTQSSHLSGEFCQLPWAGLGFDHRWSLAQSFGLGKGFVQGNFDQALLHHEPSRFKAVLSEWLLPLRDRPLAERAGWVCGLGHGVLPKTPEQNVRAFVQLVREVCK